MLLGNGWQALEHRWNCRWGEIDLLVAKPERLLPVKYLHTALTYCRT